MSEVLASTLDRTRPPKPGKLPEVSFPPFIERTLANGLKVYIVENHEQPIVSVSMYVLGGSSQDPAERQGLASITGEMLTKGTARRTALQIADEIDFVGGSLNSGSSWDANTVSVTMLTKFLPVGLDLLSDVILNPTFPQEELDRVKLQRLASIKQAKADAGYLADTAFSKLVFGDHAYGQQAGGSEQSVEALTVDDVKRFHESQFGVNNAFLIAAGDVDVEAFLSTLNDLLGNWGSVTVSERAMPELPQIAQSRVALVSKPAAVQSAIRIGHLGIERNHPDFITLYVMNMLLGGYFNSRINLNLREKNGYTYGARSFFDARVQQGPFAVSTEVSTAVTAAAVREIISELTLLTVDGITDEELSMVKNYVIGSFPLQIETPQQVASRVAMIVLYGLDKNYYDSFRDKVARLTREDIRLAAKKYLHPSKLLIVASGDIDSLHNAMAEIAPLDVYDQDGNRIAR
jgi:zinc protease